jgi:hypothetical protein
MRLNYGSNMKTLNIGLANPFTGELNSVEQTLAEAIKCVRGIEDIAVRRSATEPTVIIRFKQAVDSLNKIATALDQDCIAVYDDETGVGELYGDLADKWAPFNPEYFLTI